MKHAVVFLVGCTFYVLVAHGLEAPKLLKPDGGRPGNAQFAVDGKPYLIFGGEVGNSSAATAAQADSILPRAASMHINTILMPVGWDQIEPKEGSFDFSILDHWIDVARQQRLHLVLLWFGSWKNAFSSYAPAWVKEDTRRFPRAVAADGDPLDILSTLGTQTLRADSLAFSALMDHVREKDGDRQTVLMVQVENEIGYLGFGRDRSAVANRLFQTPVPADLIEKLQARRELLSPEFAAHFRPERKTWTGVFGADADEIFMAWNYARYVQQVAQAGKQAYPLPMYMNAQLPAPGELPGEYPSGAPNPNCLDVYRAIAPAIDFYSPDIYWPNFEYWIGQYRLPGNPVFVPEARLESAPFNALYAFGAAGAFGFSAFGIDSAGVPSDTLQDKPSLAETYAALENLGVTLIRAQDDGGTQALVLHSDSPRPTRTIALGGYLFDAALVRSWPDKRLLAQDGAMLVVEAAANEFFVVGSGLSVSFTRDPDVDDKVAGIASIEQGILDGGKWIAERRLNGDQTNQGRQLTMSPGHVRIYRVQLYSIDRQRQ